MEEAEAFLSEIEAFLQRRGMPPTTFGLQVARDPSLVSDLRKGRMPNLRLVGRVREFIREKDAEAANVEPAAS